MAIAALANIPTIRSELDTWSFDHMVHHRDINKQIFILAGIRLDEYILDPIDPNAAGAWEYLHQAMHQQVNQVLGLGSGFDLSDVAWTDPNKLSGWIQSNFTEHRQWADILGVN